DGEGQERYLPPALDRRGHLALVPGAVPGDPPRHDLAPLGDEVLQIGRVLVVDLEILVRAVAADLAPAETAATAPFQIAAAPPLLAGPAARSARSGPAGPAAAIAERHLPLPVAHPS